MKKIITLLLTLVMAICLVNVHNNNAKAENSQSGLLLGFFNGKFGLYSSDEKPYSKTETYETKYDSTTKTATLVLKDGFDLEYTSTIGIETVLNDKNSPVVDNFILDIQGNAKITYVGTPKGNNIFGIGCNDDQRTLKPVKNTIKGNGVLNIDVSNKLADDINISNETKDPSLYGIYVYGDLIKEGNSIINISINGKASFAIGLSVYNGDFTMKSGEININSDAKGKMITGILNSNSDTGVIDHTYIKGGKININTDNIYRKKGSTSEMFVCLLVVDNLEISGGTTKINEGTVCTEEKPEKQYEYLGFSIVAYQSLKITGGNLIIKTVKSSTGINDGVAGLSCLSVSGLSMNDIAFNKELSNIKDAKILCLEEIFSGSDIYTLVDSNSKLMDEIKIINQEIPGPEPSPEAGEMPYDKTLNQFYAEFKAGEASGDAIAHFKYDYEPEKIEVKNTTGATLKEDEEYIVEREGKDLKVTFISDYLNTLKEGPNRYKINIDNHEYKVLFNISGDPTPSPKKDESCEKVIGPTWHWNNAKGVCEEYATVGTATR